MTARVLAAAVATACLAAPATTSAQQAPPQPSASPAANPIGPQLTPNDPCTSLAAIVSRPSVTSSVCTVRPNHVEVETGYANQSFDGGGNVVTYPQMLVRAGLALRGVELDVAPPQLVRSSGAGGTTTGTSDAGVGLKYVIGATPRVAYGAQVMFTAPTGTNGVSANGTTATYALNGSYTLSPALSLGTTLAAISNTDGLQRWSAGIQTLVLGVTLPNGNGLNAEVAQFTRALGPGSPARIQYLIAVSHAVGPRVLIDVSAAASPTTATGRYRTVGIGASFYF